MHIIGGHPIASDVKCNQLAYESKVFPFAVSKLSAWFFDTVMCFFVCLFVFAAPCSLWDLSSLSRDRTQSPGSESLEF